MKLLKFIMVVMFFIPILSSCMIPTTNRWKEEVQLNNGSIIWVERTIKGWKFLNMEGNWGYDTKSMELKVIEAINYPKPPIWSTKDDWYPLILDRDENGIWYIIATTGKNELRENRKFLYAQFKAIDGKWKEVEIDKNLDKRDANLEPGFEDGKMPNKLFLRQKKEHPIVSTLPDRYYYIDLNVHSY